jgi:adenylylsulfate kinase-like enzyme
MRESRRLVYVSGAPGSGKTSLAVPLAAELGWALLTKDRIKETLHDALEPPEPDREWSRRLGATAMELLWALAADAPAVVIEANFRPYSEYERGSWRDWPRGPLRCIATARLRSRSSGTTRA